MAIKEHSRFEVGDWVVHYYHGVGKVKDIVEKGLDGNEKTFYKVTTNKIEYWIPVEDEDCDHIEPIRSKKDFDDALKIISDMPKPIAKHHKTRKKRIHERWLEGSLASRAKLLRDLHGRLKLEKLSFSEKEMFEKVERYYINEWIITDETLTRDMAYEQLQQSLNIGVEKAKRVRKAKDN